MEYRFADGRLLTVDVATAEWRLDGFRISEPAARDLLAAEMVRHGLAEGCVRCGSPLVVAGVRPGDDILRARGRAPLPAARYCGRCLPTVVDWRSP